MSTAWNDPATVRAYLRETRGGIPLGAEQVEAMHRVIGHFRPWPRLVVDLGCGDGFLARTLLERFAGCRAVLVDASLPMLAQARAAMAAFGDRCTIAHGDLGDPLENLVPRDAADCVVSGYAIHHLPDARKRALYAEIFAALAPGGVFVNVEHVASATPAVERLHDAIFVDHLATHSGRPRDDVAREYAARPDKADNVLADVFMQLDWLRDAGFGDVDCFVKYFELAVFGGVKPRA